MGVDFKKNAPDFEVSNKGHGRNELRQIWVSSSLNEYVTFPHVGQVFLIERHVEEVKPKHCEFRLSNSANILDEYKEDVISGKEVLLIKNSNDGNYELGFKNKDGVYEQKTLGEYQNDEAFQNAISNIKTSAFSGTLHKKHDFRECIDPIIKNLGGQTHYKKCYSESVYGVTSLKPEKTSAENILNYNRGHWGIENRSHYVRDKTFDEDRSQVRTKSGPMMMATIRNFAISICRLLKIDNIAKATRDFAKNPHLVLQAIGI